jgi:hypothetical protein
VDIFGFLCVFAAGSGSRGQAKASVLSLAKFAFVVDKQAIAFCFY